MSRPRKGKEDLILALREQGFTVDEAARAYQALSDFLKKNLEEGNTIHILGVVKLQANVSPPRTFADNLHGKMVHFGERVTYTIRTLFN